MRVMSMRMTNLQMEELLAPTYKVGVYCRLSKEDEDIRDGESQSIGHQREMIEEFCRARGWAVEEVYVVQKKYYYHRHQQWILEQCQLNL